MSTLDLNEGVLLVRWIVEESMYTADDEILHVFSEDKILSNTAAAPIIKIVFLNPNVSPC